MRKLLVAALAIAVLVAAVVIGFRLLRDSTSLFEAGEECTARVGGHTVTLTPEQAENAGVIAAISVHRGMPARAATIALATALQESKLYNLETGDRDSLGLFQQRPSQGWGTEEQLLNPFYAANAFYDALERIDGYQTMPVTEAAQEVQRSGYPEAYAAHEADARVLASTLTGYSAHAFSCRLSADVDAASHRLRASGLTRRADVVRRDLLAVFGDLSLGGFAPGGVSTGHMEESAHYEGRAIDVFVRPISPAHKILGWAIAHYLVAEAQRLSIQTVIFDDRIWRAGSDAGWADYDPPERSGDRAILEHRDHVHVDVFE